MLIYIEMFLSASLLYGGIGEENLIKFAKKQGRNTQRSLDCFTYIAKSFQNCIEKSYKIL